MKEKLENLFLELVRRSKFVPNRTLNKNVKTFTTDIGIKVRKKIQPLLKSFLKDRPDRNVLLEKYPNLDKDDVIMFVCTHSLEEDVIATYVTVDRSYYTVIGTIEQIKNYPKIIFGWLYGLIAVDRHNKKDKAMVNDKQVRVHNKGTSSFICAEASYNNSENLPIEEIFSGFYRAINKSNKNVKIVVISHFSDYNYYDYFVEEYFDKKGIEIPFYNILNEIVFNSTKEDIETGKFKNGYYNKDGKLIDLTDLAISINDKDNNKDCHTRYSDPVDVTEFFKEYKDLEYEVLFDEANNKLDCYKLISSIKNYNNLMKNVYLEDGTEVNLFKYLKTKKKYNNLVFYDKNTFEKIIIEDDVINNYNKVLKTFNFLKEKFSYDFSKFINYLEDVNKKEKTKSKIITEYVRDLMATETWYQFEDNTKAIKRESLPKDARKRFLRSRYDEYMRVKWPNIETLIEELIYYEKKNPNPELLARRAEFYNMVIDFWNEDFPEDNIDVENLKKKVNYELYEPSNNDEKTLKYSNNDEVIRMRVK